MSYAIDGMFGTLIQKFTGRVQRILSTFFFFSLFLFVTSKASNNTNAAMKKQMQQIHSIFSHKPQ